MSNLVKVLNTILGLTAVLSLTAVPVLADVYTWVATLEGSQEVPPIVTPATGMATLTLDDASGLDAVYHVEFTGLLGAETAAHFHAAPAGQNGGAVFALPLGSPKDGIWSLDLANFAVLAADGIYVNVHTDMFPAGELRGQLILTEVVSSEEATWGGIKSLYR
jgi:hypothetical protein